MVNKFKLKMTAEAQTAATFGVYLLFQELKEEGKCLQARKNTSDARAPLSPCYMTERT